MRLCRIDDLQSGMMLAGNLYLDDGRLLASNGAALTADGLNTLRGHGFTRVAIHEHGTDDIEIPLVISEGLQRDLGMRTRQLFNFLRRKLAGSVDKPPTVILASLRGPKVAQEFAKVDLYGPLEGLTDSLLVEVAGRPNLDGLGAVRRNDDLHVEHAINVSMASSVLGYQTRLSGQRRIELALGELRHDVGMIFVSNDTAEKPGRLTVAEMSRILAHPRLGYALLQLTTSSVWYVSNHVALQHHERQDGQGYPRGLFGTNRVERIETELFDP